MASNGNPSTPPRARTGIIFSPDVPSISEQFVVGGATVFPSFQIAGGERGDALTHRLAALRSERTLVVSWSASINGGGEHPSLREISRRLRFQPRAGRGLFKSRKTSCLTALTLYCLHKRLKLDYKLICFRTTFSFRVFFLF